MHRFLLLILFLAFSAPFIAAQEKPLTQQEYVRLLYQATTAAKREQLTETIRTRGIDFALTDGLRGLTRTKGAGDQVLLRTLEEAARRKENPTAAALPSETEAAEVLSKARDATLAALEEMPDFVVKQLVSRSYGYAGRNNFQSSDRLTIAVSYRAEGGEEYKLLAINGIPQTQTNENKAYSQAGGTTSTGEFVTVLKTIFTPDSKTEFQTVDTDTLRGRRTIVYSYSVKRENSKQTITSQDVITQSTISGIQGKIWIDREDFRVLRVESAATEIPTDFPVRAASRMIDYDWVTISEQKFLLPVYSDVRLTSIMRNSRDLIESRNEIRFRNYQKFGSEVKILDDDDEIVEEPNNN